MSIAGLLFVGPKSKLDGVEQAEFQSIVSGESVSIAVKHEKAKSLVDNSGVMAGNEVPAGKIPAAQSYVVW